jgi:fumarylacetoacetate (FAA) hydrolase
MICIDYYTGGGRVKLARMAIDGTDVIVEVRPDSAEVIGPGGQELLLRAACEPESVPRDGTIVPLSAGVLRSPLPSPPAIRDFFAFEQHMRASRASGGLEPDPGWYEQPYFYFSNPAAVLGPGETVVPPRGTRALDYELEVAAVIGRECADLDPDDPATMEVIAGFTILNDWSARDIQGREMRQNLGPQKAKDFATSIGPWLVTPDELNFKDPARPCGFMRACVNGQQWSDGDLGDIYFPWTAMLAHAAADTRLLPGDVLGSGTCGTGCILELRWSGMRDSRHWLRPGDEVVLSVDGLGSLRNVIGARREQVADAKQQRA